MAGADVQSLIADRIGGANFGKDTVVYKFERIKRAKAAALSAHPNRLIIDMGVGEPDAPAHSMVVQALAEAAGRPANRFYADNGIDLFKRAAVAYLARVYQVEGLDADENVVHCIGSKSAFSLLPQAFINPGDYIIQTVPGYPVLATVSTWLGGQVYNLPITPDNSFLPDLLSVPEAVAAKAKLLYLNYPNNPTGATATRAFFEQVIAFAKRHNVLIVHDAAYAALTFDGEQPLSFLSVPGAIDVGIEVHSMSKAFNMTGWRLGFVAGNRLAVKAFATVKDNSDSGQFRAIQIAAALALAHPEWTEATARKYSRRHERLVTVLAQSGFAAQKPKASFYLYVQAPQAVEGGPTFADAASFSDYLIRNLSVSTVPWDDAGPFVRWSVTYEAEDERQEESVMEELGRRLSALTLRF